MKKHQGAYGGKPTIEDLPILQFSGFKSKSNNYFDFKRAIEVYAVRAYGDAGLMFEKFEHYNPPRPVPRQHEREMSRAEIAREKVIIAEELKIWIKKCASLKDHYSSMWALLWGQLSPESEEQVKKDEGWEQANRSRDPLDLWKTVRKTHQGTGAATAILNLQRAVSNYERLRQGPTELITDFKRRTDEAIAMLRAAGQPAPENEHLIAVQFVTRLDDGRYATLKADLENSVILGRAAYPETLDVAYNFACRWVVPIGTKQGGTTPASDITIFTTNFAGNSKKVKKGKKTEKPVSEQKQQYKSEQKKKYNKQSRNGPPPSPCRFCGDPSHWNSSCPTLEAPRSSAHQRKPAANPTEEETVNLAVAFEETTYDETGIIQICRTKGTDSKSTKDRTILLDNQATAHVFRDAYLLSNVRTVKKGIQISGIGGQELSTNTCGEFGSFGTVWTTPDSIANVLSYSAIRKNGGQLRYDYNLDTFEAQMEGEQPLHFRPMNGLYGHVVDTEAFTQQDNNFLTTVHAQGAAFSKRQLDKANEAREIQERLGNPSIKDFISLVDNGAINNLPITREDIIRAKHIYGSDVPSIRGKTTSRLATSAEVVPPQVPGEPVSIHTDIMFIEKQPYLITVGTPVPLTMVTCLMGQRSAAPIAKALADHINVYRGARKDVHAIISDGEGAIIKIRPQLMEKGITVNISGAGSHAPVVERRIRVIKERVRGILSTLPYALPQSLFKYLVAFAVSRLNLAPANTIVSNITPRQWITGARPDFKRDVRIAFGEYVEAHNSTIVQRNSMSPRTDPAIALLPTGNSQGSVWFYSMRTGGIISRDHWTSLPITPAVIAVMNEKAMKEPQQTPSDPTFTMGDRLIQDSVNSTYDLSSPIILDEEKETIDDDQHIDQGITIADKAPTQAARSQSESPTIGHQDSIGQPGELEIQEQVDNTTEDPTHNKPSAHRGGSEVRPEAPVRYNLRQNRSYGHLAGDWRHRTDNTISDRKEYGLHITLKKAMDTYGDLAQKTLDEEVANMERYGAFEPFHYRDLSNTQKTQLLRTSSFIKEKFLSTGKFDKLRARLVMGGDRQDRSMFPDLSSPTISTEAVFLISAIAAKENRHVVTADISSAYLNAPQPESSPVFGLLDKRIAESFCRLYPRYIPFRRGDGSLIIKLRKAVYGCVESAKLWYEHISGTLRDLGLKHNPVQPCTFNIGGHDDQLTVGLFVDDMKITCRDENRIDTFLKQLESRYGQMKITRGSIHSYLGMTFDYSTPGEVRVSMGGYIQDLIRISGTASTKVKTPATANLFKIREECEPLEPKEAARFHSMTAKLLYLAKRTRPEILVATIFLTTRVQHPDEDDQRKLQRVLNYLQTEPDLDLTLRADSLTTVTAYVDASYAVHNDFKSHTGGVITLGGGPIHVKSSKQKLVSKSSTEAELIGLSDYTSQIVWTRDFLAHQGYIMEPAKIHQDNKSAIALIERGRGSAEHSRHINVRFFFIKDRVDKKELCVTYTPTEDMVADILTKPLQGALFKKFRDILLNGVK